MQTRERAHCARSVFHFIKKKKRLVIRCSCQGDCTGRCTCHSLGIKCTSMCSTCRGVSCSNCDESPDDYENNDENAD